MNKLNTFFTSMYKSMFSPKYYVDIVQAKTSFSLKYYFMLAFLVAVVTSIGTTLRVNTYIAEYTDRFFEGAYQVYPRDLVISYKDGAFELNKPEPYFFSTQEVLGAFLTPQEYQELFSDEFAGEFPENLLVIDSEGTIDDLEEYNTLILVNDNNIIAMSDNGYEVQPLTDMPEGDFQYNDFVTVVDSLQEVTPVLPTIAAVIIFFGLFLALLVFRPIYLLFVALALLIVGNIRNVKLDFTKYYQIALHAVTLPLLLNAIFTLAFFALPIPMWFFLLTFVIGILGLEQIKKSTSEGVPSPLNTNNMGGVSASPEVPPAPPVPPQTGEPQESNSHNNS